jgi:hypothetical protein
MPVFVKDGGIVPLQPSSGQASTAGSAPLTLRVFAGASGSYTMYDDTGDGLGYTQGQHTDTPISYRSGASTSTVTIGPASGSYPGAPATRQYTVDVVDLSSPASVQVDGQTLPSSGWSYDSATHTLRVPLSGVPAGAATTVTQTGGTPVRSPEPATTQLAVNPLSSLVTTSGTTTTVSSTLANSGPGDVNGISLGLTAPSGWTVTPTTPTTAPQLGAGAQLTASWSVTAPSSGAGQTQTAILSATAHYTDAATGMPVSRTTQQVPAPVITAVSPATASVGQVVTVSGLNFGAKQADGSYVTFSDNGTNWGAPPDLATFSLDGWSDGQLSFTIPSPSGSGGEWHVVPGSTATVTVTTADGTSSAATLTIGSG